MSGKSLILKAFNDHFMEFINDIGDANFEGQITDYRTNPLTLSGDAQAAMNRFTITVRVKYTNAVDRDLSF